MAQSDIILSVIIVSYNTADLTTQAVKSVIAELEISPQFQEKAELIVVDNNSTDETLKQITQIKAHTPYLRIIKNKENLGFAKANNIGINQSLGEIVLLLNSDTIVKNGALQQLVQTFQQQPKKDITATLSSHRGELDKLGILAALLLNPDGTVQSQGGSFPSLLSVAVHMLMIDKMPLLGQILPSTQHTGRSCKSHKVSANQEKLVAKNWVGATAMAVKKQVFNEIGVLDSNIFMYGEDVEFCLRAQHHHWDVAIDPKAQVIHYGSASSNNKQALIGEFKGYIYIWAKHKPHWQMFPLKSLLMIGALLRILIFGTILGDKSRARVYKKAIKTLD